jgi:hypothetical protein
MNRYEKSIKAILDDYPVKEQWRLAITAYYKSLVEIDTLKPLSIPILWVLCCIFLLPLTGISNVFQKLIVFIGTIGGIVPFGRVLTRNAYNHLIKITESKSE